MYVDPLYLEFLGSKFEKPKKEKRKAEQSPTMQNKPRTSQSHVSSPTEALYVSTCAYNVSVPFEMLYDITYISD